MQRSSVVISGNQEQSHIFSSVGFYALRHPPRNVIS